MTPSNLHPLTQPPQVIPSRPEPSPLATTRARDTNAGAQRRKPRKDEKPLDEYLIGIADTIYSTLQYAEEQRVRNWVTLIRRHRGSSLSDAIGLFNGRGKWVDVNASNIRVLNIVEPAVRANTSTMTQANVALEFTPATSAMKGAASVAEAIIQFLEQRDWTESLEYRIADLTQLSSAAFLHSEHAKDDCADAQTMRVPDVLDSSIVGQGEYACASCGQSGTFDASDLKHLIDDAPEPTSPETPTPANMEPTFYCPECGGETEILEMPESTDVQSLSFSEMNAGDSKTTVVSPFEIRMAERGTEGGNLAGGNFFEHHFLMNRAELEELAPHLKLGTPSQPSYSLRWQHALQNGLKTALETWTDVKQGEKPDDLFEVRIIYLKPSRYRQYVAPSEYNLRDSETNETIWNIQPGETIAEAVQRVEGLRVEGLGGQESQSQQPYTEDAQTLDSPDTRHPKGICFWMVDKQIVKPPHFADFTKEWAIVQFTPDAYSAWARAFTAILSIQSDVNDLNTIMMMHLEKNAISNVVVDTDQFDFEDFEQDFVPTKSGSQRDRPIRDYFAVVEPPSLGAEPINYMTFLLSVKDDLSGVQPASVGASQPGQPYAAQLLQVNQSQGLLAPALKSKAQAKVTWAKQQLTLAKQFWSEERFKHIESRYGTEWQSDDIQSFLDCDLERDIIVSYISGSEVPKTLQQREIKLNNFISQVAGFAKLAPDVVTPQMLQELVGKLADYSDVEFDAGNYQGDQRLAKSRLEKLQQAVALFNEKGFQIPIDPATGEYPVNPETGESMLAAGAKHIIVQARCQPVPQAENHLAHKEFWADHIRAMSSNPDGGDEIMLAVMLEMWTAHSEAEVKLAQMNAQKQIDANAPVEAKQQQMREQELAQQQQMEAAQQPKQIEAAMQAKEAELAAAQEEESGEDESQSIETKHKLMDIANHDAQRQHELELAEMERRDV